MSGQPIIKRVPDDAGRFTALTPHVQDVFLAELAKGDWPQLAAFRAGISPKSVQRWIAKGTEDIAIEPYASFVAEVVKVEADIAGKLTKIILDDALGLTEWTPDCGRPRPNVESAKWLLQNRFRFFWGTKDGTIPGAAVSIAETVERQVAGVDEAKRDKARKILAALPSEARANARKEGFLL